MGAEAAVVARLLAATGVSALVGERVSPLQIPERPTYPAIAYRQLDREPVSTFGGDQALSAHYIEVECWGESMSSARAVGDAVRAALQRFRGSSGGETVQASFLQGSSTDYDAETRTYVETIEFKVWIEEA